MEQFKGTAYGDALAQQYAMKQMKELSSKSSASASEKSVPTPTAETPADELDAL